MSKDKPIKKWQGLNPYRYKDNPMERKLALAWEKFNQAPSGAATHLDYLMDKDNKGRSPATGVQRLAVNTVIQWLGSPVGFAWLVEALGPELAKHISSNAYEPAGEVQPGQSYRSRDGSNRVVDVERPRYPLGHVLYKTGPYAHWTVRNSINGRRSYVQERFLLDIAKWRAV